MTLDEENEYIERAYVLTLENDRTWYDATRRFVDAGAYTEYRKVTEQAVIRLMRDFGDVNNSIDMPGPDGHFISWLKTRVGVEMWDREESVPGLDADNHHVFRADKRSIARFQSTAPAATSSPQPEIQPEPKAPTMNTSIAFQTVHYVYGIDVTKMSAPELIQAVKKIEAEIAELSAVKTTSAKITSMIADLTTMLTSVVAALDTK